MSRIIRNFKRWLYSFVCRHAWLAHYTDIGHEVYGFKNPYHDICGKCGKSKIYDEDE